MGTVFGDVTATSLNDSFLSFPFDKFAVNISRDARHYIIPRAAARCWDESACVVVLDYTQKNIVSNVTAESLQSKREKLSAWIEPSTGGIFGGMKVAIGQFWNIDRQWHETARQYEPTFFQHDSPEQHHPKAAGREHATSKARPPRPDDEDFVPAPPAGPPPPPPGLHTPTARVRGKAWGPPKATATKAGPSSHPAAALARRARRAKAAACPRAPHNTTRHSSATRPVARVPETRLPTCVPARLALQALPTVSGF